jgi:hypothetical protein
MKAPASPVTVKTKSSASGLKVVAFMITVVGVIGCAGASGSPSGQGLWGLIAGAGFVLFVIGRLME